MPLAYANLVPHAHLRLYAPVAQPFGKVPVTR